MARVSVIIPAYQEAGRAGETVRAARAALVLLFLAAVTIDSLARRGRLAR